jgi:uncharacterized NAD-dependent epimerase/dehydratase family protein
MKKAIVYCDDAFNTPSGKTAHGLVRFTERYKVLAVIDRHYAGRDARDVLDGKLSGIPVVENLEDALEAAKRHGGAEVFVIGLAPDGGRLPDSARDVVKQALMHNLDVDSGLHDFLSDDPLLAGLAAERNLKIKDVRKPPERKDLHFFSGKIEEVDCLKLAILGTDSAIGKRTTAWIIVHGLRNEGHKAELIGTGQTAWMQGAKYSIILDSLINDFVSGEIEHAVHEAWKNEDPDAIILEGQGSLMNPAYPGGFELLAAGRPDYVILQHAPTRLEYDGFPGYILHPLDHQIKAIEFISGRKVIAITVNHENMKPEEIPAACAQIEHMTGLPAFDVLHDGPEKLIHLIKPLIRKKKPAAH